MNPYGVEALLALSALFGPLDETARREVAAAMSSHVVAGRDWLFREGDEGDAFYLVRSGRLEVVRTDVGVVAVLGPGDTLGEVALLEGQGRSAGVRALRDSELLRLDQKAFRGLLADGGFSHGLLRAMSRRLRLSGQLEAKEGARAPVLAVGHAQGVDTRPVLECLVEHLAGWNPVKRLDSSSLEDLAAEGGNDGTAAAEARLGRAVDDGEQRGHQVVLDAGQVGTPWAAACARQADVLLLVVENHLPVGLDPSTWGQAALVPWSRRPPQEGLLRPSHGNAVVYWVRPGQRRADIGRMARRITGRAVGIVMSGGGARGFAHIGVLQVLAEEGRVIDRFGGTSVGSLMAALAASGHSPESMEAVSRAELVERRPFADWTLPRHALIRGTRAVRALKRLLPTADIRQLPFPFFAVAADLQTASEVIWRHGAVWRAVGTSMSLPGLAPPMQRDGRLLVDGGVLNNLPIDVMHADGEGPVIAVDVGRQFALSTRSRLPSLAETMAATMGLSSRQETLWRRGLARLIIEPELDLALLDWNSIRRAIAAGRRAAEVALDNAEPEVLRSMWPTVPGYLGGR